MSLVDPHSPEAQLAVDFAVMARELATLPNKASALKAIVGHAAQAIPGVQHAGITVQQHTPGRYASVAVTSEFPLAVDKIQYDSNEGPCVDAIWEHHVFLVDDLRTDPRWPIFGPLAVNRTGVLSMLSHRLFLDDGDTFGSLNLYSTKPSAFSDADVPLLTVYATHAAIALARLSDRDQNKQLQIALASNRQIGMAIGVLISRFKIRDGEAFDLLRVVSQHTHRKLATVALDVIETGTIDLPN